MLQSRSRNGILIETLFLVEGDLVENYNNALETVIGKRTPRTSFYIDRRGESPELEQDFGQNYLQAGAAHRYCVIVSPEQKDAVLIHEEFSFDREILNHLYRNYLSGISLATRVDGLYGEIDDGVREFETVEDILLAKTIHLELHTPSKFLTKARTLQQYVEQLKAEPDLLVENESALPGKILELVKDVGDIRGYDLRPIQATKQIQTFYTRLFGGVCVFKDIDQQSLDQEQLIYGLSGETITAFPPKTDDVKQEQEPSKTVVLYREKDYHPEDGPLVTFIPLQDKARVISFLVEYGYADYSYELLESALTRLEDETLLSKGHDVTEMEKQQRAQMLHQHREAMLFEWYELKDLKRSVSKGHQFKDVVKDCTAHAQSMLLISRAAAQSASDVLKHVLTRLNGYGYEKMLSHNKRHLERLYTHADRNKQKYILHVLTQHFPKR